MSPTTKTAATVDDLARDRGGGEAALRDDHAINADGPEAEPHGEWCWTGSLLLPGLSPDERIPF
jgi:hypothetical protein